MTDTIKINTDFLTLSNVGTILGRDERGNTVRITDLDPPIMDNAEAAHEQRVSDSGGAAVGQVQLSAHWPERAPQAPPIRYELVKRSDELQSLRDDNTKLENDLAYERYRVRQLELLLGSTKQPLSFAWHDQPDVAAPPPKGPPPIPARALRPLAGHPMPWLTE